MNYINHYNSLIKTAQLRCWTKNLASAKGQVVVEETNAKNCAARLKQINLDKYPNYFYLQGIKK